MLRTLAWAACIVSLLGCTNSVQDAPPEPEGAWRSEDHEALAIRTLRLSGENPLRPILAPLSGEFPEGRKFALGKCWAKCEQPDDCGEGLACLCEGKGCAGSPYVGPGSQDMRNVCNDFLLGPY